MLLVVAPSGVTPYERGPTWLSRGCPQTTSPPTSGSPRTPSTPGSPRRPCLPIRSDASGSSKPARSTIGYAQVPHQPNRMHLRRHRVSVVARTLTSTNTGGVRMTQNDAQRLVKSKQRVADHGEVFTPAWIVEDMLDRVKHESERIDSRVLEPACGSGNFLVPVLARKLATVQARHGRSEFEKRHYALLALMCVYGIELLEDNAEECRENLSELFNTFLGIGEEDEWAMAARVVLAANIVRGDALTMAVPGGDPITFA